MLLPVVTRYIQEAGLTQSVGRITLFCTTAPSDPAVKCDAIIRCRNETTVKVEFDNSIIYKTTQPCNITISVILSNIITTIILDQIMFTDVTPLIQPTTMTIPTNMSPTSKDYHSTQFLL